MYVTPRPSVDDDPLYAVRLGLTGMLSFSAIPLLDPVLPPIIAARGHARAQGLSPTPALTNPALFARDQQLCLYCGQEIRRQHLTRDHVVPLSHGGKDIWENVVAACFHCNSRKGGRTPQQAHMPLLAVPYRPSWVEHLILSNRNILADQMAFLKNHLPKHRPKRRLS